MYISTMVSSKSALTRLQTVVITLVVIVVVASGIYYYVTPPPPPATFSIQVIPDVVRDSYPGQQCVLLVAVEDEGEGSLKGGAVTLTVTVPRADVDIEPEEITPGQVAEVTVIPSEESANFNLNVTITGERGGLTETDSSIIEVGVAFIDGRNGDEDPLTAYAREIQSRFIPWLAANYPEFGITDKTEWTGISIRPNFMVVMYYLFLSDEWEMGLTWHVMIPPSDWARIYLRHRFTELSPSYAFEISSLDANEEPHSVDLEDAFAVSVWR